MTGAALYFDLDGLDHIADRIEALAGFSRPDLLEIIGATVESQTRRRIAEDKASSDGDRWPGWSEKYAKTRHSGHSLIEGQGDLLDSLTHLVGADDVQIGSNLIYAATHQFGDEDRNIPQRQYLGLSSDDEEELDRVIGDFFREILS